MCGVTGFTHWNRANTDHRIIRSATAALHHRGPDQQNVYVSPHVSLGAVRLKIVDLTAGEQPFASEDGSAVVAFNGEIYNHGELRAELEHRGRKFRTRCDTEVLLAAFLEWDIHCFEKLRGMFAAAIWSEPDRRLVLVRDRIGIKPLYFFRHGNDLHFASELKSLWAHPDVSRELDGEALDDYLSLNYVPGPRTLVRGITKLRPGCYLEHTEQFSRVRPYWTNRLTPQPEISISDATQRLDELLRQSVREHIVADVPTSVWLSGGLDSSTLLHYACESGLTRPKTFSIAFENSSCDERRYFREVASRYGSRHEEYELRADATLATTIEELATYSDEPGADAGALPVWFLSKLTRQSATVALSGEGGDELFGGYATYQADRVARHLRRIPAEARSRGLAFAQRLLPVSDRKISFEYKLKRLLEGSLMPADASHTYWNGTFSTQQKQALLVEEYRQRALVDRSQRYPRADEVGFVNRYLLVDQLTYLPDNILYKVDRMSMAHSIEVRPAFLDHRIVEFAASLPQNLKLRGLTTKYILRRAMRNKLPACVLQRGKQGFDIPTHEWFRGVLRPLLAETLSTENVERSGIFHPHEVRRLVASHLNREVNAGYHLWGLVILFLWLKRWKIETAGARHSDPQIATVAYGT